MVLLRDMEVRRHMAVQKGMAVQRAMLSIHPTLKLLKVAVVMGAMKVTVIQHKVSLKVTLNISMKQLRWMLAQSKLTF